MEAGSPIPNSDHVSRFVPGSKVTANGRISGTAFKLRDRDKGSLSVNWLEYFNLGDRRSEIAKVREAFIKKGFNFYKNDKFVVLNVGETISEIRKETDNGLVLSILYMPSSKDKSHAVIHNVPKDDSEIGDMIADLIEEADTYQANS